MGMVLHRLFRFVVGFSVFVPAVTQGGAEETGLLHRSRFLVGFCLVGGLRCTAEASLSDPGPSHLDGSHGDGEKLAQRDQCRSFCAPRRHESQRFGDL